MDHRKYDFTRPKFETVGGELLPRGELKELRAGWEMDERHVEQLHQLAMASPKGSALCEIGSLRGSCTSAFVEALKHRDDLKLYLYETEPTPELLRLLDECSFEVRERIKLYPRDSLHPGGVLYPARPDRPPPAIVLIDGNHKWFALIDLGLCLLKGCDVICMHDTQRHNAYAWKTCHGSILGSEVLRNAPGRSYHEDKTKRDGERTHRGLLVSWLSRKDWPCSALPLD